MNPRLTRRETRVAKLATSGLCNKEIAWELGISIKTVQKHRDNINKKVGVTDSIRLTHWALRWGLVELQECGKREAVPSL